MSCCRRPAAAAVQCWLSAVNPESGKTSLLGYAECNAGDIDDPHIIPVFGAGNANGVLFIAVAVRAGR